jgi:hypothetical protein
VCLTFKSEGSYNPSSNRGSTCLFKKKKKKSEVAHVCGPSGRKEKRLNASLGQTEKEEKRKVKKK